MPRVTLSGPLQGALGIISPLKLAGLATGEESLLSSANITNPKPNCFWLFKQLAPSALPLAKARAGSRRAARIAIMAITTSSSINVNPLEYERFDFILRIDAQEIYPLGQAWQALSYRLARQQKIRPKPEEKFSSSNVCAVTGVRMVTIAANPSWCRMDIFIYAFSSS